ncbi:hypothetical protein HpCK38_17510 [Helicobacter pylori]
MYFDFLLLCNRIVLVLFIYRKHAISVWDFVEKYLLFLKEIPNFLSKERHYNKNHCDMNDKGMRRRLL